jgi:hypothetical protein
MKKVLFILFLLIFTVFSTQAQNLTEISRTRIEFGPGKSQIGIEQGAGEHWKPLFFSVDDEGIIHIPDFYKNRIACFDKKGKLLS